MVDGRLGVITDKTLCRQVSNAETSSFFLYNIQVYGGCFLRFRTIESFSLAPVLKELSQDEMDRQMAVDTEAGRHRVAELMGFVNTTAQPKPFDQLSENMLKRKPFDLNEWHKYLAQDSFKNTAPLTFDDLLKPNNQNPMNQQNSNPMPCKPQEQKPKLIVLYEQISELQDSLDGAILRILRIVNSLDQNPIVTQALEDAEKIEKSSEAPTIIDKFESAGNRLQRQVSSVHSLSEILTESIGEKSI